MSTHRWSDPEVRATDIASLARTPSLTREILANRPPEWLDAHHLEDSFSPRQTVGHLIYNETENWIPRVRQTLETGLDRPFGPLDIHGGDPLAVALPIDQLIQTFAQARADSLQQLESLQITEADLGKLGLHPKFGPVTLDQLLSTWVTHDLYHLGQIFKAFAAPLRPAIGPWQDFLNLPHFN